MEIFNRPGLLYISHRGFRPLAPDNSLPGFEYAGILKQCKDNGATVLGGCCGTAPEYIAAIRTL